MMSDAVVANNLCEILNLGCDRKMSFIEWINSDSGVFFGSSHKVNL